MSLRWEETDLTPEEQEEIFKRHTAKPDDLDGFLDGVSQMDGAKLNRHADELRKDGASDSFLALCIRLVWGGTILLLIGSALYAISEGMVG